ncbi:MAG: DUF4185 domain-containing protein [Dermatophilaceae bacterium]|nr:DUF4185 domain-containing protein [Dermatophilaceae bacterium]NUO92151.1 DUF4185 domain-containing protein [Dermatophilaceae bacterium]NUR17162.1 DUF4185 domain-containing protein [Dermatophilaceae bacterium]
MPRPPTRPSRPRPPCSTRSASACTCAATWRSDVRVTLGVTAGIACLTFVGVTACSTSPTTPAPTGPRVDAKPGAAFVLEGVEGLTKVAQLTGHDSMNRTADVEVVGQDLGSMFDADGRTWFVFGDTFGARAADQFGGGGTEWRSNALAWTTDTDPTDGITFGGYVLDDRGRAKELIPGKKVDDDEMTVIPTYGFAANGAMYLAYMSVRHWGDPGEWETNYAGLARSTDQGQTWTPLASPRWGGTSNFVQVSVTNLDGVLYFWGVTHGRFGGVALMRVAEADVERQDAYEYLTAVEDGEPVWGSDPAKAHQVIEGTVGELSVMWSDYLHRWVMTCTDGAEESAVIREGLTPWGPWGDPKPLVTQADLPGLYSPYLHPRYVTNGGRTVYFTISQWGPYNVFWYRADLKRRTA